LFCQILKDGKSFIKLLEMLSLCLCGTQPIELNAILGIRGTGIAL
jgi:hypothetical protein